MWFIWKIYWYSTIFLVIDIFVLHVPDGFFYRWFSFDFWYSVGVSFGDFFGLKMLNIFMGGLVFWYWDVETMDEKREVLERRRRYCEKEIKRIDLQKKNLESSK